MNSKSIKSDLARIDRMRDSDIDYSDIPPVDKTLPAKAIIGRGKWPIGTHAKPIPSKSGSIEE